MKAFWAFLLALVWKILGWQVKNSQSTMQDGEKAGELEDSLKDKIKKDGWNDAKADITDPSDKS